MPKINEFTTMTGQTQKYQCRINQDSFIIHNMIILFILSNRKEEIKIIIRLTEKHMDIK